MLKALKALLVMTLLTGILYPLMITAIASVAMPFHAGGSLVEKDNKIVGSLLLAQGNSDPRYFWARPSAVGYKIPSGSSNLGPTSRKLQEIVAKRLEGFKGAGGMAVEVPSELLYASASGLDPHISLEAAYFQIERIAKARQISSGELKKAVDGAAVGRQWGVFGPRYVNVLQLNMLLDKN